MFGISVDRSSPRPVTAQLCSQLRRKIETGELAGGTRLPSTRNLAQVLGISRNIAIDVYEQLIAEGYLIGRTGSGTYVAEGIADAFEWRSDVGANTPRSTSPQNAQHAGMHSIPSGPQHESPPIQPQNRSSGKLQHPACSTPPAIEQLFTLQHQRRSGQEDMIHFATGVPDLRSFPRNKWALYLKAAARETADALYDYGDIRGEEELRAAIASFLYRSRGMRCEPDQIVIVSGSSEGFALIAQALRPLYHTVLLEDPTIDTAEAVFTHAGYRIDPVGVDESGMKIHERQSLAPGHLILLTPSHQYPTGSILSIQRRLHAVALAERADACIVEDDYDGDFRLKGVPVPPLQTLGPEHVIYAGTFSKTLAPGLRLGFLVLPYRLIDRVLDVKDALNLRTPAIAQIALARFIRDGHLERHIHKMRVIYRNRRHLLIAALHRHFGSGAVIRGDEAGMHLRVEFPHGPGGVDWSKSSEFGVTVQSVEEYCRLPRDCSNDILLGYGNVGEEDIERGIERLSRFVRAQGHGHLKMDNRASR